MSDERTTSNTPVESRVGQVASAATSEIVVDAPSSSEDGAAALGRLQQQLESLRAQLEASEREKRYVSSSPMLWIALGLEVVVAGLTILAIFDWFFTSSLGGLFFKLVLAIVLQLGALTAVAASRRES